MTKKSGVLFVIVAHMALGAAGSIAGEHHHYKKEDKTNSAALNEAKVDCFRRCDTLRGSCEVGDRSTNECSR